MASNDTPETFANGEVKPDPETLDYVRVALTFDVPTANLERFLSAYRGPDEKQSGIATEGEIGGLMKRHDPVLGYISWEVTGPAYTAYDHNRARQVKG